VSKTGHYEYIISNTLTGCTAYGQIDVKNGEISADFDANPTKGYAPLTVNFNNISSSSLNSSSITSIWSFGNGATQTTSTNIGTITTYTAPGTYTVMLLVSKGGCLDTLYKTIKIEIPSKLEVPNVFTPNGDGSNDVFFLKTANLTEISVSIFDRWGNKVYEVISATGNISWDGKNQGRECAQGVYFYIIKATGKDEKSYETKGNVSLYR
jgi:gliding motility-associated-like protein